MVCSPNYKEWPLRAVCLLPFTPKHERYLSAPLDIPLTQLCYNYHCYYQECLLSYAVPCLSRSGLSDIKKKSLGVYKAHTRPKLM